MQKLNAALLCYFFTYMSSTGSLFTLFTLFTTRREEPMKINFTLNNKQYRLRAKKFENNMLIYIEEKTEEPEEIDLSKDADDFGWTEISTKFSTVVPKGRRKTRAFEMDVEMLLKKVFPEEKTDKLKQLAAKITADVVELLHESGKYEILLNEEITAKVKPFGLFKIKIDGQTKHLLLECFYAPHRNELTEEISMKPALLASFVEEGEIKVVPFPCFSIQIDDEKHVRVDGPLPPEAQGLMSPSAVRGLLKIDRLSMLQKNVLANFYKELVKLLKKYFSATEERHYTIIALWIIATYFHDFFKRFPYLHFRGPSDSGKTTASETVGYCSYHPFPMISPRAAPIFRLRNLLHFTFIIDNAERFARDTEVVQLLLSSFDADFPVPRTEEVDGRRIVVNYRCYGPVIMNSIAGLQEVLQTRALEIPMLRDPNFKPTAKPALEDFELIRQTLYRFRFIYAQKMLEAMKEIDPRKYVETRYADLFYPLFCVAKLISEEVFSEVVEFAKQYMESRKVEAGAWEEERIVLYAAHKVVKHPDYYSLQDIASEADIPAKTERAKAKKVSEILKRLKLGDKKKLVGGRTRIFLSHKMIHEVAARYGITLDEVEPYKGVDKQGKCEKCGKHVQYTHAVITHDEEAERIAVIPLCSECAQKIEEGELWV